MPQDEFALQLHQRAKLGQPLTPAEQAHLDRWYAEQDAIATAMLTADPESIPNLADLQQQIDRALIQLTQLTQHIQQLTQENVALRQENAALKQQISLSRSA